jgi:alpha-1,2-mannosyltransferase
VKRLLLIAALTAIVLWPSINHLKKIYIHNEALKTTDFSVFRPAGEHILEGAPIYKPQKYMSYLYAPFTAYSFGVLSLALKNPKTEALFLMLLNYIALFGLFFLIFRIINSWNLKQAIPWFFTACLLILITRYYRNNLSYGQINMFLDLILLTSLYALFQKQDLLAGFLLAVAGLTKLPLFIFLLFFVLERRWKALSACSLAVGLLLLLPSVTVGWETNLGYLQEWLLTLSQKSQLSGDLTKSSNYSLLSSFAQVFSPAFSKLLAMATALSMIAGSTFCFKRSSLNPNVQYWGKVAAMMVIMIIAAPTAWRATYVHMLYPLSYVVFLGWAFRKDVGNVVLGGIIVSFILSLTFVSWLVASALIVFALTVYTGLKIRRLT